MCAARPPTDGSNAEDVQDRAPRADLCASAAPGRAREKMLRENKSKRRQMLAWGRRSGRRGEEERPQKKARAERGDWCLCLFLSVFALIKYVIYLSTNYENINF